MLSYIVEVIGSCAERTLSDETTFRNLSLSVSLINHGWLECLLQETTTTQYSIHVRRIDE